MAFKADTKSASVKPLIDIDKSDSDKQEVRCDGEDTYVVPTESGEAIISMSLHFSGLSETTSVSSEYCETDNLRRPLGKNKSVSRKFSSQPYCLSWDSSENQSIASHYIDHSTDVALYFEISQAGNALEKGTVLRKKLLGTNDQVLRHVYDGFGKR